MPAIRHAAPDDASAITDIWNVMIRDTVATFNSREKSVPEVAQIITSRPDAFFVAEDSSGLLGFATFAQFRPGTGYASSMEHTIMLRENARAQGTGRALMETILTRAREHSCHVMVAALSGENTPAIAFHRALGFEHAGLIPQAGRKLGRWHDLVLMQRRL